MEFYRVKKKSSKKMLIVFLLLYFSFYRVLYGVIDDFRVYVVVSGIFLVVLFMVNAYLAFGAIEYEKVRAEVLCESRVDKWRALKIRFKNCPFLLLLLIFPLLLLLWLGANLSSTPILMSLMFIFYLFILSLSLYGLTQNRYLVTEKGIADASSRSIFLWEEIEDFEIKEDVMLVFKRQRRFCDSPILLDGSEEIVQILSRKIN